MMQLDRIVRSLVPLGALLLVLGCDSYEGRQAVSGRVTLAGQPLKQGSITFVPLDKQGTQSGTGVTDGEYSIPRKNGLKPGKYLVSLTSPDGKTPAREEDIAGPASTNIVSVDLIPPEWNSKSDKQVEVKSSGENKFDFDIPNVNPAATKKKR